MTTGRQSLFRQARMHAALLVLSAAACACADSREPGEALPVAPPIDAMALGDGTGGSFIRLGQDRPQAEGGDADVPTPIIDLSVRYATARPEPASVVPGEPAAPTAPPTEPRYSSVENADPPASPPPVRVASVPPPHEVLQPEESWAAHTPAPTVSAPAPIAPAPIAPAPPDTTVPHGIATPIYRQAEPVTPPRPADPRSIQIVAVPVPRELPATQPVTYEVVPTGAAAILSPLQGAIPPGGDTAARRVIVTVRVPSGAAAGPLPVGAVRFSAGQGEGIEVRVTLIIARIRGAAVTLTQDLYPVRQGDAALIRYGVVNRGNAPDTFALVGSAPPGWIVTGSGAVYTLKQGERREGTLTVRVPRNQGTTTARVELALGNTEATVRSDVGAYVEVIEPVTAAGSDRLRLTTGVASVVGDTSGASPVLGLELNGPLTRRIQLFGRAVQPTNPDDVNRIGLSRVGYILDNPFLTAVGPNWQGTVGSTGREFSPVTGTGAYGRGASFSWRAQRWETAALAAMPYRVGQGSQGHLVGAQVGYQLPDVLLQATATDLKDDTGIARELRALGLGAEARPLDNTLITAEVAHRDWATGSGFGYLATADRRTDRGYTYLSYTHAPGGSSAFARITDEFSGNLSQRFDNRWAGRAAVFAGNDNSSATQDFRSRGWSVGPSLALSDRTTLTAEASRNSFTSETPIGSFGNAEFKVSTGITTQIRKYFTNASASFGQLTRSTVTTTGAEVVTRAGRETIQGQIGWTSLRGSFQANGSYEHTAAGVGYFPNQVILGLTADQLALRKDGRGPLLSASFQHYEWFGSRSGATVIRLGSIFPVGDAVVVSANVERNPFLRAEGSSIPWVLALKVERSWPVALGGHRPTGRGAVFQDLNANGRRDAGEPGMGGVLVRQGTESVVTDKTGNFRFYGAQGDAPQVDATSLPFGTIPAPRSKGAAAARGEVDLPVLPTGTLEVHIVPTADEMGRLPKVDPTRIGIRAVDQSGGVWTMQADSTGKATLDALPSGTYRIELDFSDLQDQPRLKGQAPTVEIRAGEPVPPVELQIVPRPVRIFDGTGGSGSHGKAGPRPTTGGTQ